MRELTPRQRDVLAFICRQLRDTGLPPTRAEIVAAFGLASPNAAQKHLLALARAGAIELQPGISRGLRLLPAASSVVECAELSTGELPVIGRVAAGSPILAAEHIEASHRVDPALFHPRADYLLRVRGSSMRDAGILDGDLIAVHRTPEARDRQIVVARIDDDVTVKRFRRDGDHVQLIAENPDFAPIEIDLRRETLDIEGLCVGVLRFGEDGL